MDGLVVLFVFDGCFIMPDLRFLGYDCVCFPIMLRLVVSYELCCWFDWLLIWADALRFAMVLMLCGF